MCDIEPGGFVLAHTTEYIGVGRELAAQVSPLSHLARVGLAINLGSDWINPGFGSMQPTRLAIEIANHNPSTVTLTAGMPICHLRFAEVATGGESLPPSFYEGSDPLGAPGLWEDFVGEDQG